MRTAILVGLAAFAAATVAASPPAEAQAGGAYMWCLGWKDNGVKQSYYYSGFFSAAAWEKDRKALMFKSVVEDQDDEISAAKVGAMCFDPADYNAAIAARNGTMKTTPGKILSWEG
jgi:hypothetical protein